MEQTDALTIAIVGGTGPEGRGLGLRWARAGHRVVIGSRSDERAQDVATALAAQLRGSTTAGRITGADNLAAAREGDVVVLAVPYSAQADTLREVAAEVVGKVLVTVVVPLRPPRVSEVSLPDAGSAAVEAQEQLGSSCPVVAAFQNVSAAKLLDVEADVGCDVLVCADDMEAKTIALRLAADCGTQGYDAGPLANAGSVEGLTSILIGLNQLHKARGAGIRITNMPRADRTAG